MRLLRFLKNRSPSTLIIAVLVGILSGATSAGLVAIAHRGLNDLPHPHPLLMVAFAALCLLNPCSRVIAEYLLLGIGQSSVMELRLQLTRRILSTPLARLEALGRHRLLATLIEDVNSLSLALVQLPAVSVLAAIIIGCLFYMAWLSWSLFLLLLAVMTVGAISYQIPLMVGERRFHAAREERDRLYDHFRGLTEGIQELKLHQRRSSAFVRLVHKSSHRLYRLYVNSYTIFNVSANWGHLLFFVVLGLLIFGGSRWLEVESADLTGYALVLLYMMSPLQGLLDSIPVFSRATVALKKIETLGFELQEKAGEVGAVPIQAEWQRLELRQVAYSYGGEGGTAGGFTVGPFDLTFEPGELVFLVGGNGSGKTTFAKLLTGLYAPHGGEILLDGNPITEAQVNSYRQLFSMVFVTPHLFDELLGIEQPNLDEQAAAYLRALELQEKVQIEDGRLSTTALSQGQKKRLALLVAYLEDRSIYIFDEWAADQDPIFRQIFYSKILPGLQARGKTLLVISHDDRYYGLADRVIKLELGQVVFDGDYSDLLEKEREESIRPLIEPPAAGLEAPKPSVSQPPSISGQSFPTGQKNHTEDLPTNSPLNWRRPVLLAAIAFGLALIVVVFAGGRWFRHELAGSLPRASGELALPGIEAGVKIQRDSLGIPTVKGSSRRDVAFATGFIHAQDRFFQMDLLRRRAAGELAEFFGASVVENDRQVRRHRLRARAREFWQRSAPDLQALIGAYTRGVNAGLTDLRSAPFEYAVLGVRPDPWQPEDSFLVVMNMFIQLQQANGRVEEAATLMTHCLPEELFDFLTPAGSEWDVPILGTAMPELPIPSAQVVDLRREPRTQAATSDSMPEGDEPKPIPGSNAWALAPSRTTVGALLANELHLDLSLPNLWYRAALEWLDNRGGQHRAIGVTLPGTPALVLGSNGVVAWGLTNSVVDTHDLVLLEEAPDHEGFYLTPEGPRPFLTYRENIRVRGGSDETLEVVETHWGPLVGEDHRGRKTASSWTLHRAVDFESLRLETARGVEEALAIAQHSGTPAMNFFAVDKAGRIGWTISGRLPQRVGFSGEVATRWADGTNGWSQLLDPAEVPQVIDPASGQLWNANNRMVGGEMLALLGDGGYALGARAGQIRDALQELESATPKDMIDLQLDDRALFMRRWRDLLLQVLSPEAVTGDSRRKEGRRLVQAWGDRAAVESAGYRLVRSFRLRVARSVFEGLLAPCTEVEANFDYMGTFRHYEEPLWTILRERPAHLIDTRFDSWDEQLLAAADSMLEYFAGDGRPLAEKTWGERNTTSLRHPLSLALPWVGRWLDTPAVQLPGDDYMPRVQSPFYGATLRMVVIPGREEESFFHMPGGQSGHPLSPHYQDGHAAWAAGEPTPFLPGETVSSFQLVPQ